MFLLLLALLGTFAGCAASSAAEELNIILDASPSTLDPQLAGDTDTCFVARFFTSSLYEYNQEQELVPCLAEGYDLSEDGLVYTFHLRKGLVFSDGRPLTAEDFVCAFQRLADPDVGSTVVFFITDSCTIRNAREVNSGTKPVTELGVSAPDDTTLVVELEAPCPYFCDLMTRSNFTPCDVDFYHAVGDSYGSSTDTILSCGPYIVDRYEPLAAQIHLKKNPNYIHADEVRTPGVTIQIVGNEQQALMCYQAGSVDIMGLSGTLAELAEGDPELHVFPEAIIVYLKMNEKTVPALANRNIRLALSKCLDREAVCTNVLCSGYSPLTRINPPGFYMDTDGTDFSKDVGRYDEWAACDPEEALRLWEQGMRELGADSLTLSMLYAPARASAAEAFAAQMEERLPGLKIELKVTTVKDQVQREGRGEFDLILTGWVADYIDPTSFLGLGLSSSYPYCYQSQEYAALYDRIQSAEAARDPSLRNELMHQAEDMLMEDAALIPLYTQGNNRLVRAGVHGFRLTPTSDCIVMGLYKEVNP